MDARLGFSPLMGRSYFPPQIAKESRNALKLSCGGGKKMELVTYNQDICKGNKGKCEEGNGDQLYAGSSCICEKKDTPWKDDFKSCPTEYKQEDFGGVPQSIDMMKCKVLAAPGEKQEYFSATQGTEVKAWTEAQIGGNTTTCCTAPYSMGANNFRHNRHSGHKSVDSDVGFINKAFRCNSWLYNETKACDSELALGYL